MNVENVRIIIINILCIPPAQRLPTDIFQRKHITDAITLQITGACHPTLFVIQYELVFFFNFI